MQNILPLWSSRPKSKVQESSENHHRSPIKRPSSKSNFSSSEYSFSILRKLDAPEFNFVLYHILLIKAQNRPLTLAWPHTLCHWFNINSPFKSLMLYFSSEDQKRFQCSIWRFVYPLCSKILLCSCKWLCLNSCSQIVFDIYHFTVDMPKIWMISNEFLFYSTVVSIDLDTYYWHERYVALTETSWYHTWFKTFSDVSKRYLLERCYGSYSKFSNVRWRCFQFSSLMLTGITSYTIEINKTFLQASPPHTRTYHCIYYLDVYVVH